MSETLKLILEAVDNATPTIDKVGHSISHNLDLSPVTKTIEYATLAVGALAAGLAYASTKAMAVEDADRMLGNALKSIGQYSESTVKSYQAQAEALAKITNADDETIKKMQARALQMGVSTGRTNELVKASLNLSAATGVDAPQAMDLLIRSLEGYGRGLKFLVPGVAGMTAAQLANGDAIKIVQERFDGFAEAAHNTYRGSLTDMEKAWEDGMLVPIGKIVTQSPTVIGLLNGQAEAFKGIGLAAEAMRPTIENLMSTMFGGVKTDARSIADNVVDLVASLTDTAVRSGEIISRAVLAPVTAVEAVFQTGTEYILKFFSWLADLNAKLPWADADVKAMAVDMAAAVEASEKWTTVGQDIANDSEAVRKNISQWAADQHKSVDLVVKEQAEMAKLATEAGKVGAAQKGWMTHPVEGKPADVPEVEWNAKKFGLGAADYITQLRKDAQEAADKERAQTIEDAATLAGKISSVASGLQAGAAQFITSTSLVVINSLEGMSDATKTLLNGLAGPAAALLDSLAKGSRKTYEASVADFAKQVTKIFENIPVLIAVLVENIPNLIWAVLKGIGHFYKSIATEWIEPIFGELSQKIGWWMVHAVETIGIAIGKVFAGIGKWMSGAAHDVVIAIGRAMVVVGTFILGLMEKVLHGSGQWLIEAPAKFGEWVSKAIDNIGMSLDKFFSPIGKWFDEIFSKFSKWISTAFKDAGEWLSKGFQKMFDWIVQATKDIGHELAKPFVWFYNNVLRPIANLMIDIYNTGVSIAGGHKAKHVEAAEFRASGGPIESGRPYWVGERGPELIVPKQSGYVHPAGSAGAQSVTINVTEADDARMTGAAVLRAIQTLVTTKQIRFDPIRNRVVA